ncbi:CsbD family protein [Lichenicoccus sp.]|uniref:CsbD family protein n=1 Tax=Lichenicoccus sp. TaxID=2781899 RepID=UPI003D0CFE25
MVDTNRIEGAAEDTVGKLQDGMGGLLGDGAMQARGKARQVAGQAQGFYGETLDTMRDLTADQPILALLAASLLGFILGALFARR